MDGQFYWNPSIDEIIEAEEEFKRQLRERLWGVRPAEEEED